MFHNFNIFQSPEESSYNKEALQTVCGIQIATCTITRFQEN